jgi:beta-lactamase superfamily II metal-dependent hydrolase
MSDYYQIDFLGSESEKSCDAISLRYRKAGVTRLHVVDGGYADTGEKLVQHIRTYYEQPAFIDSMVVSHPDQDHATGLQSVLEAFKVGELWMLRPWLYAEELLGRFSKFSSVEGLRRRLKELYPQIAALESLAEQKRVPIREPFQGARIGDFLVLSPTRAMFLDLVVLSEKTPETTESAERRAAANFSTLLAGVVKKTYALIRSLWGDEVFSVEETSSENEMSVVQFLGSLGSKFLLTADAGRGALAEAIRYSRAAGVPFPVTHFQVPHHGSRRNVSSEVLDELLGPRLPAPLPEGQEQVHCVASVSKNDEDHPRKSVVRAVIHRGGALQATRERTLLFANGLARSGWTAAPKLDYPDQQEEQ